MINNFLTHLAAIACLSGNLTKDAVKQKSAETKLSDERDIKLLTAFGSRDYEVSIMLGRPYKYEFPSYLREKYDTYEERRKAEIDWQERSRVGITLYISRRDGWYSSTYNYLIGKMDFGPLINEQKEFMSWYHEAMDRFPHYAVRHVYIEDYPDKESYFEGVEKFRIDHHEIESIFGDLSEPDDPAYDQMISKLFYAVDPSGENGGLRTKYDAMRFVLPYQYHEDDWGRVKKYYTALSRILRNEGEDPNDFLERTSQFSYDTRKKVMEKHNNSRVTKQSVLEIMSFIKREAQEYYDIFRDDMPFMKEVMIEGYKTLLRIDGYDPKDFSL